MGDSGTWRTTTELEHPCHPPSWPPVLFISESGQRGSQPCLGRAQTFVPERRTPLCPWGLCLVVSRCQRRPVPSLQAELCTSVFLSAARSWALSLFSDGTPGSPCQPWESPPPSESALLSCHLHDLVATPPRTSLCSSREKAAQKRLPAGGAGAGPVSRLLQRGLRPQGAQHWPELQLWLPTALRSGAGGTLAGRSAPPLWPFFLNLLCVFCTPKSTCIPVAQIQAREGLITTPGGHRALKTLPCE